VLLAEDNDEMRQLLVGVLKRDGYQIVEARDGRELLALLDEADPSGDSSTIDLVVSDIRMPLADGLTVLARLRQLDWSTPVILITAFGSPETHARARELGAAIVLDKPFELDELRHAVHSVVPPEI
jgi:CheY-like chemotaxis protein